ncbi:MAG: pyruvate, phosphate dikinase [Acidimicrobiia bacterium]|nr:MAG: pyruvate, phosphate dikinase [Acidimicrobiia bacterium]
MTVMARYAYDFDHPGEPDPDLLGGKGAGLATMTRLGLPVPPGFTLTTEACLLTLEEGGLPETMWTEAVDAVRRLEERTGRRLGGDGGRAPLLLSVRSGARFSMPGMMDTVLNLGCTAGTVDALIAWSGNPHFAWDAARRFVQTYAKVVLGIDEMRFQEVLTDLRERRGVPDDASLTPEDLEEAESRFRRIVAEVGEEIPADPLHQLHAAVEAVFGSWNNRRAREYRRIHGISESLGTAANVQMMVFGDLGEDSGTGVCFTRNPATGENRPYGDYLPDAQGEDVVAGIRNTLDLDALAGRHPQHHAQLVEVMGTLEGHYKDMCDIEFTIEREVLWILQTRVGKRTAAAAVRMSVEMESEGLIDRRTALLRVDPSTLEQLLHPRLVEPVEADPIATGLNASPGAARGEAVFDADRAVEVAATGTPVILVRWETTPDDIHGMAAAQGILTSHGGRTSHAAVVARGMGIPAVTGAGMIAVDQAARRFTVDGVVVSEGDMITLDGGTGRVYLGGLPVTSPEPGPELEVLLSWADEIRRLGVRANADDGPGAREAARWGAEGIGLARTEHMFMGDRLPVVRRVILQDEPEAALAELQRLQVGDFETLLEAMDGKPVVVRLLDPPLHEFLPSRLDLYEERAALTAAGGDTVEVDRMVEAVKRLEEANPMMGLRGVRLGVVRPELYRAQVRAALEAVRLRLDAGGDPRLEIMIPLVATGAELSLMEGMIQEEVAAVGLEREVPVGTMIEIPRAALCAGELATHAAFFSFGTNDLTQMTFGISRDDAQEAFLRRYLDEGMLASDPFATLDIAGVGRLIEIAAAEGRAARPGLELGICGEHGGDPATIAFCERAGLDYVSCSPPRVPIARLAAAQATIGGEAGRASV